MKSAAPGALSGSSAAPPSSMQSIHISGCTSEILVPTGSLIEPRVAPGTRLDIANTVYGPNFKKGRIDRSWKKGAYEITVDDFGNGIAGSVSVSVQSDEGHTITTIDGIVLGKDTFSSITQMLEKRGVPYQERLHGSDNMWLLSLAFPSACGQEFISEYDWVLYADSAVNKSIGDGTPLRSDIFLKEVASDYSLVPKHGYYETVGGLPSTHN